MTLPREVATVVGDLAEARSLTARATADYVEAEAQAKRAGRDLDDARARERVAHERFLTAIDRALERLYDGAVA